MSSCQILVPISFWLRKKCLRQGILFLARGWSQPISRSLNSGRALQQHCRNG